MHAKGQREVKVIAYALIIAGLICLAGLLLSGRSGPQPGDNGERAAQQVNRAAELNQQAGAADCQKLVEQIRSDNRRAKQIIDELISGAQAGEAADAAH